MTPEQERSRTEVLEIYRLLFETWRFQVDSGWQRSSYFAAFETALLLGIGKIIVDGHVTLGAAGSLFGLVLTRIWLLNDRKVQSYIDYWWEAVRGIERDYLASTPQAESNSALPQWDFAWKRDENLSGKYRHDDRRNCGSYRSLMRAVPWLFTFTWSFLFVWSLICFIAIACTGGLPKLLS